MPGTSAAHTIWFIAAVIVAGTLAGAIVGITFSFSNGLNNKGNQIEGQLSTQIEIINDQKRVPYNDAGDIVTFYVKNTGTTVVNKNASMIFVLITGVASAPPTSVTIYGSSPTWKSGEVAIINVHAPFMTISRDYSVKITVSDDRSGASASDTMDFNIIVI